MSIASNAVDFKSKSIKRGVNAVDADLWIGGNPWSVDSWTRSETLSIDEGPSFPELCLEELARVPCPHQVI